MREYFSGQGVKEFFPRNLLKNGENALDQKNIKMSSNAPIGSIRVRGLNLGVLKNLRILNFQVKLKNIKIMRSNAPIGSKKVRGLKILGILNFQVKLKNIKIMRSNAPIGSKRVRGLNLGV